MPYYGQKSSIECLGCNISIHDVLDDWNRQFDWGRQLCIECSDIIPNHIPKEQYGWYKIMFTKLDTEVKNGLEKS